MTVISPDELAERLYSDEEDDPYLLDIRNVGNYDEWHIPGSENLPIINEVIGEDYSTLKDNMDTLPENQEIVVVCIAGVTSSQVAEVLRDHGYDAVSLEDGMNGWGRVHRAYDIDDVENVIQVVRPGTGCVSYLVHDDGKGIVVDPSQYHEQYHEIAEEHGISIVGAVDTHAHADHVSGAPGFNGPYYLHFDDIGERRDTTAISDGEAIQVGELYIDVLYTPGHTPGSVSLRVNNAILSGDTVFMESVGRPDLETNSKVKIRNAASELYESAARILAHDSETLVLPGHISDESERPVQTTVGELLEGDRNELLTYVAEENKAGFIDAVLDGLSDEPANYNEIKHINWGEEEAENTEELELGPNNCAAN